MTARFAILGTVALLTFACTEGAETPNAAANTDAAEASDSGARAARWDLSSSGEGVALVRLDAGGKSMLRLFCPAGEGQILVNVQAFRPVGSEERMTFGSGGEVTTLVADPAGDRLRGGVSGTGPVPDNLLRFISGPIGVNYGAQNSGPHPAPPAQSARAFAAACAENGGTSDPAPPADSPTVDAPDSAPEPASAGACRQQNGATLPPNRLRGIGTEPFWGVRVEGRCVTYSTPENQSGTRIWTKFSGTARSGTWTGFYQNQTFVMRTRPEAGCSDGMSDNRYPIAVTLEVGGEQRRGCAQPL